MSKQELPQYNPSVGINVTDFPDVQQSADRLAASLQDFNSRFQTIPQEYMRQEGELERQALQNNISVSYQTFAQKATENPNSAQGLINYDKQAKDYAANILANTSAMNKKFTANTLNYYANVHRLTVQNKVFEQSKLAAFQTLVNHSLQLTDDINTAIHMGNTPQALELAKQQRNLYSGAQMTGVISNGEYERSITEFKKSFQVENALKQYSDALNAGKSQEFLESFQKANIPSMSEQEKLTTMVPLFRRADNLKIMELGINQAQITQMMKQDIQSVREGGMPNSRVEDIVKMADPKALDSYQQSIGNAKEYFGQTQYLMSLPQDMREQALEQLRPKNPNDPNFIAQKSLYDDISKGVSNLSKQFNEDPVNFILKHPIIKGLIDKRINGEQTNSLSAWQLKTPVNDPVQPVDDDLITTQQLLGRSFIGNPSNQIRLLTNAQLNTYMSELGNVNPNQKVQIFSQLKDYYGNNFPLVLNDLKRAGMPSNWQLLARINPSSPYADQVAQALTTPIKQLTDSSVLDPVDRQKIDDLVSNSQSGNYSQFFSNLGATVLKGSLSIFPGVGNSKRAFDLITPTQNLIPSGSTDKFRSLIESYAGFAGGNDPGFLSTINDGIRRTAYQLTTSMAMSPQDATAAAMDAFTDNYNYRTYQNQTLRIPSQYNPDTILSNVESEESKLQHFDFVLGTKPIEGLTPQQAHDYLYRTVIQPGHWVNDHLDKSLVRVDVFGRPVVDKDGHVFSKPFDDAQNNFPTHQVAPRKIGLYGEFNNQIPENKFHTVPKLNHLANFVSDLPESEQSETESPPENNNETESDD